MATIYIHNSSPCSEEETANRLLWRNVRTPCPSCGGAGGRVYANTATWRHGRIAGQALTYDVCDVCWGSGDAEVKWSDIRRMTNRITALEQQIRDLEIKER